MRLWEHWDHGCPDLTDAGKPWHCFLLSRVSTISLISRTSTRQQQPAPCLGNPHCWLLPSSCNTAALRFIVLPFLCLMSFPFIVIVILHIFARVLLLLESQIHISPLYSKCINAKFVLSSSLACSYPYLPPPFPISSPVPQPLLSWFHHLLLSSDSSHNNSGIMQSLL